MTVFLVVTGFSLIFVNDNFLSSSVLNYRSCYACSVKDVYKRQVLVQQQSTAKDGEMVVALVEDSATVKTFYKEDGYIRLQPENDTMEPVSYTHLDVYKRQILYHTLDPVFGFGAQVPSGPSPELYT